MWKLIKYLFTDFLQRKNRPAKVKFMPGRIFRGRHCGK